LLQNNSDNFRLAFAAATVHDAFNLLSVCVLLPIEIATGYLYFTTSWLVKKMLQTPSSFGEPQILSHLTKPLTNFIIQLNNEFTSNNSSSSTSNSTLIKHFCPKNTTTILNNGSSVTMIDAQNRCKRILVLQIAYFLISLIDVFIQVFFYLNHSIGKNGK
jgi:hypothetical protein